MAESFARSCSIQPDDGRNLCNDKLQKVVNDLNLSDDQKSKVKDIFTDAKSKREAIMNDTSLTDDQKRAKMKELHTGTMAKVNEVLTPETCTQRLAQKSLSNC